MGVDVDRVIVWWKGGEINKGEIVRKKKGKKRKERKVLLKAMIGLTLKS